MTLTREIEQAARELGQALHASPLVAAHLQAEHDAANDAQASRLKARLAEMYDDLVQRQSAGEVLSGGELDEYYRLEREVKAHPALARQEQTAGRLQDLFTETHDLLTNELGFSLLDMVR